MGASAGGAKAINARRGRRGSRHGAISEINVTPLVDVMLVLLIVFMVAAPLMTVRVAVNLPEITAKSPSPPIESLKITMQADGSLYVEETKVSRDEMLAKLAALAKVDPDKKVGFLADEALRFGEVLEMMIEIRDSGFKNLPEINGLQRALKPRG